METREPVTRPTRPLAQNVWGISQSPQSKSPITTRAISFGDTPQIYRLQDRKHGSQSHGRPEHWGLSHSHALSNPPFTKTHTDMSPHSITNMPPTQLPLTHSHQASTLGAPSSALQTNRHPNPDQNTNPAQSVHHPLPQLPFSQLLPKLFCILPLVG